jgi:hypothetical protein
MQMDSTGSQRLLCRTCNVVFKNGAIDVYYAWMDATELSGSLYFGSDERRSQSDLKKTNQVSIHACF